MKQYIRKADIILFICLVAAGLAASAALALSRTDAGPDARVLIYSGGELYGTYSLYTDRTINVPAPRYQEADEAADSRSDLSQSASRDSVSYNTIEIRGSSVLVTAASCANQVCVHHAPITRAGESIVCLPNRLSVRIEGGAADGKGDDYDDITS